MSFSSDLMKYEPIIGDEGRGVLRIDPPEGFGRGLDLGLRGPDDFEYGDVATAFTDDLLIPSHEWQARIQEIEERKSRLSDYCTSVNMPPLNQGQTNYCWANAPVYATQVVRSQQNQGLVLLSPASVAAQIKGYRNVGGWGKEALEWIVERGIAPVNLWPANAISKQYATAATLELAKQYRVDEWTELKPRTLDQLISMLLRRIPVAVGYNWWGHEVTAIDPVWLDGTVAIRIRNSWGEWGDKGYGILQGSKMLPDDAVAPRTALAV